ncbi:alpha/beta fold hydrolase [Limnohabitans sp.]|uniref:alpha/beta fold hydrolase n=1 Tax=Limnohabitans sp. TaxID=1907725 RepID=UPI0035ADB625
MLLPHFTALGAGPTVLMLHGAAGGYRSFAPQVEHYALQGFRAIAWDMPGYGLSAPVEPYGVRGLAQSCIHLIEALLPPEAQGAQRSVVLLGHGLGGMVAQEVVMRRPELVSRLVLSGSTSGPDSGWAEEAKRQTALLDASANDMLALAKTVLPGQTGPLALAEGVQLARHCMAQVSPVTYRLALQAQAAFDRDAALAHIHVPTLLITGEQDRVAPGSAIERMAGKIHGSRWVQMPGIGHWQNLEAPDAFDALVLDFLHQRTDRWLH